MAEPPYPEALPALTHLHWYVLERVLGQGGFGITYLAKDTNLDQRVAIKEYLPVEFATRLPDSTVRARTEELRDRYRWGLERFIQEARTLAKFDHPNIVRVLSVFEFNNTAYIVMRFEEGATLASLLDRRGTLPEGELFQLLVHVLNGLELVHNAGFIHRDIKPNNIHIGVDGRPVLLDFGSARQAVGSSNTLTILIAPGYAPFEQYYNDPSSQGPWTDIYGLAATAYRAICGRAPLDAVSRSKGILGSTQEIMVPASVIGAGRYSGRLLAAIDHALAFAEKDRPQTIAEWRSELLGESAAPAATARAVSQARPKALTGTVTASPPAAVKPPARGDSPDGLNTAEPARRSWSPGPWTWIVTLIAIAIAAVAVYQANESKLAMLEKQIQEQSAERATKQQPDVSARQPNAPEQAPNEVDKSRTEPAGTRELATARPEPSLPKKNRDEPSEKSSVKPAPPAPSQKETKPSPTKQTQPPVSPPAAASQKETSPAATTQTKDAAPNLETKATAPRTLEEIITEADEEFAAKHDTKALALLKPLAEAGNARAQLRLGDVYAEGRGVERNPATAREWYEKAASAGETNAMLRLGAMFKGANNNLTYIWYGTAAQLGSSTAKDERDRIVPLLQPAERQQADKVIANKVEAIKERAKKP